MRTHLYLQHVEIFSITLFKMTGANIHVSDSINWAAEKTCSFKVIIDMC